MLIFNYKFCIQTTTKANVEIKPKIFIINESTHICICNQSTTTPIFIFLENTQSMEKNTPKNTQQSILK
jgi:hypothetical protein